MVEKRRAGADAMGAWVTKKNWVGADFSVAIFGDLLGLVSSRNFKRGDHPPPVGRLGLLKMRCQKNFLRSGFLFGPALLTF